MCVARIRNSRVFEKKKEKENNLPLLPELHDGARHIGGVCHAVVGEAFVCIPRVVTRFPGELLKQDISNRKIPETALQESRQPSLAF